MSESANERRLDDPLVGDDLHRLGADFLASEQDCEVFTLEGYYRTARWYPGAGFVGTDGSGETVTHWKPKIPNKENTK